jgi:PTS system mannose-specific IID component
MQGLGFAYALDPALRRLYQGEEYRSAVRRHLEFFNTHPFLAAAVLGAVIRLEADGHDEDGVRRLKSALMGPYGAVGDSFYWGALKPFLIIAALHAAYLGHLWAPAAFLGSFALCNFAGRGYCFAAGLRHGVGVVEALGRIDLLHWARRLKAASAVLLGTLLSLAHWPTRLDAWEVPTWAVGGAALVLVPGAAWLMTRGVRPSWVVLATALLCLGIVVWT